MGLGGLMWWLMWWLFAFVGLRELRGVGWLVLKRRAGMMISIADDGGFDDINVVECGMKTLDCIR